MPHRLRWIAGFTLACALAAWLLPAMPQPLDYHDFADQRRWLGVDNAADVLSNLGFLVVGVLGLWVTWTTRTAFVDPRERVPWLVFFAGVLLTAFGSAWYHLAPGNERLVWDRLPMTIAFTGLIAAQLCDRVSVRAGLAVLVPGLVVGLASVLYWRATERAGAGDVIPYGVLQGYCMVVLVLLAWLVPSRYTRGNDLYWVFFWYVVAKVLETFDRPVLDALGGAVGGHALKHLAAAMAGLVAVRMLQRRAPRTDTGVTPH